MRVELNALTALQAEQATLERTTSKPSTTTLPATEDTTTFQSSALTPDALTAQALQTPAIRQDKVAALRQQVSDGTYPIDADTIASALISSGGR